MVVRSARLIPACRIAVPGPRRADPYRLWARTHRGLALALLFGLVGCQMPQIEPTNHLTGPGLDRPLPDASMASWPAAFDRLIYDIPRAIKRLHWGMLTVRQDPDAPVIRATALLPDGREATLFAWEPRQGLITVALRVGHFGDRRQERACIAAVRAVLRGKPSRRHRQGFQLPVAVD